MSDDFDWNDLDPDAVVQRQVNQVAVYTNPHDYVVIREQRLEMGEEDNFIVLDPNAAERLAKRLMAVVRQVRAGGSDE